MANAAEYVTVLHSLAQQLDANGLCDVRFVGPDLGYTDTSWLARMMTDPVVMSKVAHFGCHSYQDNGVGSARVYSFLRSSAYPDRDFWMTEFDVWCSGCQTSVSGDNSWAYARGTASYLLKHLANGASAGLVWEGYDSQYTDFNAATGGNNPVHWSYWGLFGVDNINAVSKTYTARKGFYTLAQISKFVRPGARRINISGSTTPFTLLAFYQPDSGQLTLTGINTAGSAATLSGTLASLPAVGSLDVYYTDSTVNLRHSTTVPVNNGSFTATVPADCVFTLTGSTSAGGTVSVLITSPPDGASYSAPATIPIQASASTSSGAIRNVTFFNGATTLGQAAAPPYSIIWNNVAPGTYVLTARATNSSGSFGVSPAVHVTVGGAPAITQQPQSQAVVAGSTALFTVVASGVAPLSYQWLFNGTKLANGGQFSGATSATLSVSSAQPSNAGGYSVVVTNAAGSVTSTVATLTVNLPGSCLTPPAGLVGWWPGDGNANDIVGINTGALKGGATASAVGVAGSAFNFDGTNGYVQIPDSASLHPANLTIEAWVRFASLDSAGSGGSPPGDQYIVFKQNSRSGNFEGFELGKTRTTGGDAFSFIVSSASGQTAEIDSATLVSTGVWYHVAGVRGTNFIQLFVNGQLERQTNVSFAQDYGTLPLYFGTSGQSYWDHKFKGSLDEISLYNRALSSAEIAAVYSAGAAGKCKAVSAASARSIPVTTQLLTPFAQNGNISFTLVGEIGRAYRIEVSSDLQIWSGVIEVTLVNGTAQISRPMTAVGQFYRARVLP